MANIKFSAFTQKVALGDVDFLVGYTGADNVRVAPSVFSGIYLPLAGGTMTGAAGVVAPDNFKWNFGTGSDLQIYHDNLNTSYIQHSTTGDFRIQTVGTGYLKLYAGSEQSVVCIPDGAVELYNGNGGSPSTKKFETTSLGVLIPSGGFLSWGTDGVTAIAGSTATNHIGFFTVGTEKVRIISSGEVGIGTDTPDEMLHILDPTGAKIILNTNANTADSGIYMSEGANGTPTQNGAYMYYDATGNNFKIATGAAALTDRLTIARDTGDATFSATLNIGASQKIYLGGNDTRMHVYHTGAGGDATVLTKEGDLNLVNQSHGSDIIMKVEDSLGAVLTPLILDSDANATFAGNVSLPDSKNIKLGTGQDLELFHNATDSYIINSTGHLYITNYANDKNIYFSTDDGAGGTTTYMKIDGLSEYTQFDKSTRHMDNVYSQFGNSNDAYIVHNGSAWTFANGVNDADINFNCDDGAGGTATYMFLDGSQVLTRFLKGVNIDDNVKLTFGDVLTPGDLEIYHDGSNSYIRETGTGNMYIQASERIRFTGINNEALLYLNENSNVEAYYDNALKLETTATGTKTTGQMDIAALNVAPASTGAAGTLGEIRYTADYIYVCTATNTWKRTALSTW
jgi:hypothetical protein